MQNASHNLDRKTLGLLVRDLGVGPLGSQWDLCIVIAMILELSKVQQGNVNLTAHACKPIFERYSKFMELIFSHQLEYAHELKPMLDGKKIAECLGIKPGPQVGKFMQQLIEHQLSNRHLTKDQAVQWISSMAKN